MLKRQFFPLPPSGPREPAASGRLPAPPSAPRGQRSSPSLGGIRG